MCSFTSWNGRRSQPLEEVCDFLGQRSDGRVVTKSASAPSLISQGLSDILFKQQLINPYKTPST
jgi:hypothetical protein